MEREKALDMVLGQIEKQFGKGAVMRMNEESRVKVASIPTGALSLDLALGIGGLPRGRVVEIYGPESSGKCLTADTHVWTDRGLETVAELFARCGQQTRCATRVTDVRGHGVRMVNERGELEQLAAVTHNDRQPVLRLRLASGRGVTVTHNHPLRVVGEAGAVVWRPAGRIAAGDTVVSAAFGAVEAAEGGWLSEEEATDLGCLVARGGRPDAVAPHAVPQQVRTGGDKAQRAFLAALFDGAGRTDDSGALWLPAASEQLACQVQLLLYGFGVAATVAHDARDGRDAWTVTVTPQAVHRFRDEIGGGGTRRRGPLEARAEQSPEEARPDAPLDRYTFERVAAVEDAGVQPTFDVVLPRTHSFIANGVLSHNTTVALHAIAEAQKTGGIAAFIDAEHALDPTYAQALGVDVDALLVSQPDTGEQALEIADMLIRSGAIDILVVDSVAALTPKAEIEGEMGDSHVGLQARLMSQALRKLAGTLNRSRTCAVFVNQIREKVGVMFGSPETQPGGRALKFYSSVRLDVRRIESLKDGTDFIGNRVRVKVVKNKVAPPFKQAEFDILFGEGISKEGSVLDVGVEQGVVKKAGAWYTYDGEQLGQGRENARQFLKEHGDVAAEIYKKVTERLGLVPTDVTGSEGDDAPEPPRP